jgi:hypothetical protein
MATCQPATCQFVTCQRATSEAWAAGEGHYKYIKGKFVKQPDKKDKIKPILSYEYIFDEPL